MILQEIETEVSGRKSMPKYLYVGIAALLILFCIFASDKHIVL